MPSIIDQPTHNNHQVKEQPDLLFDMGEHKNGQNLAKV
jgi:hypothetical protein